MARESSKPTGKTGVSRVVRTRRSLIRRDGGHSGPLWRLVTAPNAAWGMVIWVIFVLVCGLMAIWARQQPLVAVGQVMNRTALVRVEFTLEDLAETNKAREETRQRTARVYNAEGPVLAQIRTSIENLPKTLAAVERLDQIAPAVARQFKLTEPALAAIRAEMAGGEVSEAWMEKSRELIRRLGRRPLLDDEIYQREYQEGLNKEVELRGAGGAGPMRVPLQDLVNIKDEPALQEAMTRIAQGAGFSEPVLAAIVSRLVTDPQPTYKYDQAATAERQNAAAAAVPVTVRETAVGQVIFKRGDTLDASQLDLFRAELQAFQGQKEGRWRIWLRRASIMAAVGAVALAAAGYVGLFCRRVARNPGRMAGIAGLMAGTLGVACFASATNPAIITLSAVAPTVFVAVLLVIAYDQRVALALSALHGVLGCVALDQPIGIYALMITGVGVAVWQLREIRDRRTLVRMGVYAGLALAGGTVLIALIDRPITLPAVRQAALDAAWAGGGGLLVGVVSLAMLPTIERWFDITTGMTLIELRDPKQPLLRQLQQRAPGTYNHSLNVASIAESAADAIGADALLTYVGALYHDIGKMNKPEYFVENQTGGPNKHDKLSPAMSLLVIVGHVKDGMAMAQEYGLPRSLQHFIEAHHGTTLVEFFYSRARKQAEESARAGGQGDAELPEEIEYRYPGPKPRVREVAIVMLADAVESATRTMAEPTPSRIDALVRALANKRLLDGQFDECDLTLRQLTTICESISKSVASIYHGRVLYPSTASMAREERRA